MEQGTPSELAELPKLAELPELPADSEWSIEIVDATTRDVLASHRADQVLKTASVGKLFLLAEVARRIEDGTLDPHARFVPTAEETLADSGILYLMDDREQTVLDLCLLVGALSDNVATNVLIRVVGLDRVTELTQQLGFRDSRLLDIVRAVRRPGDPVALSVGTARELCAFAQRLHDQTIVSPAVSAMIAHWLSTDTDQSMVAAPFNLDPLAHTISDRGIVLWNKTGTVSSARIDVGNVSGPAASVSYAVLANWSPEVSDRRDEVLETMRAIGRLIRSYVMGGGGS